MKEKDKEKSGKKNERTEMMKEHEGRCIKVKVEEYTG